MNVLLLGLWALMLGCGSAVDVVVPEKQTEPVAAERVEPVNKELSQQRKLLERLQNVQPGELSESTVKAIEAAASHKSASVPKHLQQTVADNPLPEGTEPLK